eukprot:1071507_1
MDMHLEHYGVQILQTTFSASINTPNTLELARTVSYTDTTSTNHTPNHDTKVIQMPETIPTSDTGKGTSNEETHEKNEHLTTNNENTATQTRILLVVMVFFVNIAVFVGAYCATNDAEYIKDLMKTALSVMGVHLVIEHALEHMIHSLKPDDMILYSTTACIRDIVNNMMMTLLYMFDDYAYWWKPMMWGCYMADLVMLISKWHYFKRNWLQFVFAHHFGVAIMLLILNHSTKILTDAALICLILFMNSNSPGCASPIWKAFQLPLFEWSSVICFVLQRAVRFAAYAAGVLCVDSKHYFQKDYVYVVLVSFAVILDIWDIHSQIRSIYRSHPFKVAKLCQKMVPRIFGSNFINNHGRCGYNDILLFKCC